MHRAIRISLLALGVVACDDAVACLAIPCALPVAITVSVTSSVSGAGVAGSFVLPTGSDTPLPCNQAPGTTCRLLGAAGTYDLEIGAPGFQTVHRTVHVPGSVPRCGCPIVEMQQLAVVLTPLGANLVHHRGQISTLLRPMGSAVPEISGPGGDEPQE